MRHGRGATRLPPYDRVNRGCDTDQESRALAGGHGVPRLYRGVCVLVSGACTALQQVKSEKNNHKKWLK